MRDAVKPSTTARKGWATAKELSRLTGTAHHPKLAGPEARHARTKQKPLADPRLLRDAQELVRRIVKAWIADLSEPGA